MRRLVRKRLKDAKAALDGVEADMRGVGLMAIYEYAEHENVGSFVKYEHKPVYEFGPFGRNVIRVIQSVGLWHSCEGIFYVTRATKRDGP